MHGYLSADIICSKMQSSPRAKLEKTVSFEEKIISMDKFTSIFFRLIEAIGVYYPSNICKAQEIERFTKSLPLAAWDVQWSLVRLYQQTNMSLLL